MRCSKRKCKMSHDQPSQGTTAAPVNVYKHHWEKHVELKGLPLMLVLWFFLGSSLKVCFSQIPANRSTKQIKCPKRIYFSSLFKII